MAKGTLITLFVTSFIAALLIGINIGRKIGASQQSDIRNQNSDINNRPLITDNRQPISPTQIPPSPIEIQASVTPEDSANNEISTFTDQTCAISLSYPGSYIKQTTVNEESTVIFEADDPKSAIFVACQKDIPKPPLDPSKIESAKIDGVDAKLYHDASQKDGSPRDEVIVKHPRRDFEVIIAGFGPVFNQVIKTLKFL